MKFHSVNVVMKFHRKKKMISLAAALLHYTCLHKHGYECQKLEISEHYVVRNVVLLSTYMRNGNGKIYWHNVQLVLKTKL